MKKTSSDKLITFKQLIDNFEKATAVVFLMVQPLTPAIFLQRGVCHSDKSKVKVKITGCGYIKEGDENDLKDAVGNIGPISVGVDANHLTFSTYQGGVYSVGGRMCRCGLVDVWGGCGLGKEWYGCVWRIVRVVLWMCGCMGCGECEKYRWKSHNEY